MNIPQMTYRLGSDSSLQNVPILCIYECIFSQWYRQFFFKMLVDLLSVISS